MLPMLIAGDEGAIGDVEIESGDDASPEPVLFTARTEMAYEVPGARPVIVNGPANILYQLYCPLISKSALAQVAPPFNEYSYRSIGDSSLAACGVRKRMLALEVVEVYEESMKGA